MGQLIALRAEVFKHTGVVSQQLTALDLIQNSKLSSFLTLAVCGINSQDNCCWEEKGGKNNIRNIPLWYSSRFPALKATTGESLY